MVIVNLVKIPKKGGGRKLLSMHGHHGSLGAFPSIIFFYSQHLLGN